MVFRKKLMFSIILFAFTSVPILANDFMNETSAAISLRTSPGVEKSINRQEISTIRGLNMSLMPGLAGQVDQQEIADLIAYIRNLE